MCIVVHHGKQANDEKDEGKEQDLPGSTPRFICVEDNHHQLASK